LCGGGGCPALRHRGSLVAQTTAAAPKPAADGPALGLWEPFSGKLWSGR